MQAPDSQSDEPRIDAFLAYREGEAAVAEINDWLKGQGVRTHYFHDHVKPGDLIDESAALATARTMVVFLGAMGWGETHQRLVAEFMASGRPVIPVLIGEVGAEAREALDGLFSRRLYIDLRQMHTAALRRLSESIMAGEAAKPQAVDWDDVLLRLKRGSDESRGELIGEIQSGPTEHWPSLAQALRDELEQGEAQGLRGPARKVEGPSERSSIRSWFFTALIWVDAESESSRTLLLRSLDSQLEPDDMVSFWVLAGLYWRGATYLNEACSLARRASSLQVQALAMLIVGHGRVEGTADMVVLGDWLASTEFRPVWSVLRALRICAEPDLLPAAARWVGAEIEGTSLSYDALQALSHPDVVERAADSLQSNWDLPKLIELIITTSQDCDQRTRRRFAGLLGHLPEEPTRSALAQLEGDARLGSTAVSLRSFAFQADGLAGSKTLHRPGFSTDSPDEQTDHLGIRDEVATLTAVMMARDVRPPLAIGLFGNWGSGKSFFMREMERQAVALSQRPSAASKDSPYCSKLVQIKFNAWHYADSNLWASLVSCLLEELHDKVNGLKTLAQERADTEAQLADAAAAKAQAERELAEALAKRQQAQEALQQAQQHREQRALSLADLSGEDFQALLRSNEAAAGALKNLGERLGLPDLKDSVLAWQTLATEFKGQLGSGISLARSMASQSRMPLYLALLVAVLALPAVPWLLRGWTGEPAWLNQFGVALAQLAALLTGGAKWLGGALSSFAARRSDLNQAHQQVMSLLQGKQNQLSQAEQRAAETLRQADTERLEAEKALQHHQARSLELQRQLDGQREAASLGHFLSERHRSDDYRKQLGIFSMIRRDFEQLVKRLEKSEGVEAAVDRIVLYIDDLDRCPADKVVEVLQAVHLLLAYPLFVVVVGVDSRWLLHSLSSHFEQFDAQVERFSAATDAVPSGERHWTATPQHYLEKIFQIPYVLRPMDERGFGQLMGALLASSAAVAGAASTHKDDAALGAGRPVEAGAQGQPSEEAQPAPAMEAGVAPAGGSTSLGSTQLPSQQDASTPVPASGPASRQAVAEIEEAALTIKAWETDFAQRMHGLMPSPRAAKRFSNVYRILKAGVQGQKALAEFEGSADQPGVFRLAMLLLALQISAPRESGLWFAGLRDVAGKTPSSDQSFVDRVLKEGPLQVPGIDPQQAQRLADQVLECLDGAPLRVRPAILAEWTARVGRFSFDLGG